MKTLRISLFGIPAHVMVNDLPAALLPAASVCDMIGLIGGGRSWSGAAYRLLQLGNLGGMLAAAFGALDFLRLPANHEVRQLGKTHAIMNGLLLPMFVVNQAQRNDNPEHPSLLARLMLLGLNAGLIFSAWNGARIVFRHGVRTGEHTSLAPFEADAEPVTWPQARQMASANPPS